MLPKIKYIPETDFTPPEPWFFVLDDRAHKTEAGEAEHHHRPRRRLGRRAAHCEVEIEPSRRFSPLCSASLIHGRRAQTTQIDYYNVTIS